MVSGFIKSAAEKVFGFGIGGCILTAVKKAEDFIVAKRVSNLRSEMKKYDEEHQTAVNNLHNQLDNNLQFSPKFVDDLVKASLMKVEEKK